MPIDPTQDDRFNSNSQTEFSDLSTEAQAVVRELLDNEFVHSIRIYDGNRDHLGVKVPPGTRAGEVAELLADTSLRLWVSLECGGAHEPSLIVYEVDDNDD